METEESIKISLSYGVAQKAIELLLDSLRSVNLNDLTREGARDVNYVENQTIKADEVLSMADADIKEWEKMQDESDEDKVIDMICKIENIIEGGIYPRLKNQNQPALEEIADSLPPEKTNLVEFANKLEAGIRF